MSSLGSVGLSGQEEHAYRALVQLGEGGASEVARRLGCEEPAVHEALQGLERAGLVTTDAASPQVYRPLPPEPVLTAALTRRQRALEDARAAVSQLSEQYRTSRRRRDADLLVEIVTGRDELRRRLRLLQDGAEQEASWFCRADPVAMTSDDNAEEFEALARGVRYRVVYERALLEQPGSLEHLASGIRAGEQARTCPVVPVRLAIVDRKTAVCPLVPDPASGEPSAAFVGRSAVLDALLALFESYWSAATPVRLDGDGGATREDGPDEQERLLLSLFVAGVPDKAIASQLGVSKRTIQRRLADLMLRAECDTRPGLAFRAAQLGWL